MASPDRLTVPWLSSPPPSPAVTPPVIVRPERLAEVPLSTWKTRLAPPPLTASLPRPGPRIVIGPVALLSSSGPAVRVMTDGLGEGRLVEGDGGAAVEDVGEVDGLAEAELARGRAEAVDGGVDDQRSGLRLEGADVGRVVQREAALVGGHPGHGGAGVDGRAAGLQRHGLGRPAVVAQRASGRGWRR